MQPHSKAVHTPPKYDQNSKGHAGVLIDAQAQPQDVLTAHEHHMQLYGKPTSVLFLLDRYALMYGTDTIWDTRLMVPMKSSAFTLVVGRELAKEWHSHPRRRVVGSDQVVFDPTGNCGPECINLYQGLTMAPVKSGACADLLQLLIHLLSESAEAETKRTNLLNFVLDWLAYPLQHPGAKMASALVFHGPQGTGKNLFFEAYAKIFGAYGGIIGQAQLESPFNDVFSRKLFIIADEVSASYDVNHNKNVLKSYITSDVIQIETKFQQSRSESNHCNFVFLSNDARPLALERDDRRHLVVYCPSRRSDDLYERVSASFSDGGVEALYELLLARDLSGFHTHTRPPMTTAKVDLVELGLKPAERFAKEWLTNAIDLPLRPCSTGQLYRAFTHWCRLNGERNPPHKAYFSTSFSKYAGDRFTKKTASPSTPQLGTSIVFWLPAGTGPVGDQRWYDFAQDAVATYEGPLSRFINSSMEQ